jgi:serine protease Do
MKKKLLLMTIMVVLLTVLAGCIQLRAQLPYESPHTYEQTRIDMIAEVMPSVVAVRTETGHGSGIIYKAEDIGDGVKRYYVITNYHVVEDGGEMNVYFGTTIDPINVKDFAGFQLHDIAVVRFDSELEFRVHESSAINDAIGIQIIAGQDVYAIGTPENINKFNYVTSGVVAMTSFDYNGVTGLAIMHDAELNPGNSGGPLFNLNGDLIGINVAKVADIQTADGAISAEGLNYALSINTIAPIISAFQEEDFQVVVRKPRLGITVQEVAVFLEAPENDPSLLPENPVGVVVIGLDESRDAFGKVEIYDLITHMNGTPITSIADLAAQLDGAEFGDQHVLTVLRNVDGTFTELIITITLS